MLAALSVAIGSSWTIGASAADLTSLSLEDLLAREVTSVAKKPQRVDEAAGAVFVVDQDDIRRSGATDIPSLLRMVPGVEVAQLTSGGAAVSARGFNGFSANKLLVLVDGRAIYMSAFSGVFWDQLLLPVTDIQRIEVVRGPGATLWGANAVNGVINIVTKHGVDTLGAQGHARAESDGGGQASLSLGRTIGDLGAVRAYANVLRRRSDAKLGPQVLEDRSQGGQFGVRLDLAPSEDTALTLQSDAAFGRYAFSDPQLAPNTDGYYRTGNLLGRWARHWGDDAALTVQAYWDRMERKQAPLSGDVENLDLDVASHLKLSDAHTLILGGGARRTRDEILGPSYLYLDPAKRTAATINAYVEDDITLVPDRLNLSVGAKFERNDYSGFEFQPSLRAIWRAPQGWSVWAAISRASRTPSRYEEALTLITPALQLLPNDLKSEQLTAYELGWRANLNGRVSIDIAAFDHRYRKIVVDAITAAPTASSPVIAQFINGARVRNTGVEAAVDVNVTPNWTLKAAGTWQDFETASRPWPATDPTSEGPPGSSPRYQLSLRSLLSLGDAVDADAWVRRVAKLSTGSIPAYTDLDLRLSWRATPWVEVSLVGANLLKARRVEIADTITSFQSVVSRQAQLSLALRY